MKAHRMKHVPTGLYYQPIRHMGSNLSKNGKVYLTESHGVKSNDNKFFVYSYCYCKVITQTKDKLDWVKSYSSSELKAVTNINDWIKEEVK